MDRYVMEPQPGVVYLVGAGPGAADLITVRGLRCLRRADVVIYDRLVNPVLLEEAPPWAELVYVGKGPGRHTCSQTEIHALMIDRARQGKVVVRLKGGDPFVFGRGGEEMVALAAAGIPCVVVPGVSSAIGVPGCAGIPLTHRDIAGAFAVVSAHKAGDRDDVDWAALARVDTLVVLMGVARLETVTALLQEHGRSPLTPAALIERGTLPEERVIVGTLADIAAKARAVGVRPPATLVVGEVVRLCPAWQETAHREPQLVRDVEAVSTFLWASELTYLMSPECPLVYHSPRSTQISRRTGRGQHRGA